MGFTGLALGAILFRDGIARAESSASPGHPPDGYPQFVPKAKSVIWIFLCGGVSHLESFDVKPKLKQTPSGVFVGALLADGSAEVGFQQIPELIHFPGVDYVGPLPGDLQRMTMFSSGIHTAAKQPEEAKALVKHLTAPTAAPIIKKHGLEPG